MAQAPQRPHPRSLPRQGIEHAGGCVREVPVRFPARDGYPLAGMVYVSERSEHPTDAAVFNGGGGIACARYRHFLRHLASAGVPVVAYDYRGVGGSAATRRQGLDWGIEDWAALDQVSAIDFARERFASAKLSSISHSIGCMVAAGAPNAGTLAQLVFVAPHTGYWRDYRLPWRWPMAIWWHLFMPAVAGTLGYFPASWFRLGDDFPRRVALQWAGRLTADFRLGVFGGNAQREYELIERMRALTGLVLVVGGADDAFATDRSIRRFLRGLPDLRVVRREFAASRGLRFGHWEFFRRRSAWAWEVVVDFLRSDNSYIRIAPEWNYD